MSTYKETNSAKKRNNNKMFAGLVKKHLRDYDVMILDGPSMNTTKTLLEEGFDPDCITVFETDSDTFKTQESLGLVKNHVKMNVNNYIRDSDLITQNAAYLDYMDTPETDEKIDIVRYFLDKNINSTVVLGVTISSRVRTLKHITIGKKRPRDGSDGVYECFFDSIVKGSAVDAKYRCVWHAPRISYNDGHGPVQTFFFVFERDSSIYKEGKYTCYKEPCEYHYDCRKYWASAYCQNGDYVYP